MSTVYVERTDGHIIFGLEANDMLEYNWKDSDFEKYSSIQNKKTDLGANFNNSNKNNFRFRIRDQIREWI